MKIVVFFSIFIFVVTVSCNKCADTVHYEWSKEELLAHELAQKQLEAYNNRDIEQFMSVYSDSVKVFSFPDELIMNGHQEMKQRYETMFQNTPDLHCELIKRMVQGNTVIDQELVTRKLGEPKTQAIAIYKIANEKIQEVRFIP